MTTAKPYPAVCVTRNHALRHLPIMHMTESELNWVLFHHFGKCETREDALAVLNAILIKDGETSINPASLYGVVMFHASEIAERTADGKGFWEF